MAVENKVCSSKLEELFLYKNQLMGDLLGNESVACLLTDDVDLLGHPERLVYRQVFPFEFVPETVEEGKTFICCEVDIRDVIDKTYLEPIIYIWVFTHKSNLRLPTGGVRVDQLASEIVGELNGSRKYGLGELELKSVKRFAPVTDYQGRIITFVTKDYNRLAPNRKPVPASRR